MWVFIKNDIILVDLILVKNFYIQILVFKNNGKNDSESSVKILKGFLINIRSLNNKLQEISVILNLQNLDIIFFYETWCKNEDILFEQSILDG